IGALHRGRRERLGRQDALASWKRLSAKAGAGFEILLVAIVDPVEDAEREVARAVEGRPFASAVLVLRHVWEAPEWAETARAPGLGLGGPDGSIRAPGDGPFDADSPHMTARVRGMAGAHTTAMAR